jgi:hypothetical protein
MTAEKLREELAKDPELTGLSAMKKDQLVALMCEKLGIQRIVHGIATIDKTALKQAIRALKKERAAALESHDRAKLAELRHQIHANKHKLRRAVKLADQAAAHAKA